MSAPMDVADAGVARMFIADFVRREVDGAVVTLRLERAPVNALSSRMCRELEQAAADLAADADVRAVCLYGGPKNFSAGLDRVEEIDIEQAERCLAAVAAIPVPVVAAVTGYALGGGLELALCADVRVAGDNARFGDPEVRRGTVGTRRGERLIRQIGPSRAKDLTFSGRHVHAAEALEWGLVDHLVSPDDVYAAALERARQYATTPAIALRDAKAALSHETEGR
jgi:enoyl-CoA hydratase/carnithine racemase